MKKTLQLIALGIIILSFTSCATRTAPPQRITVVKTAPRNHKVVKIKDNRYYKWNNTHYRKTRKGYVVVRL